MTTPQGTDFVVAITPPSGIVEHAWLRADKDSTFDISMVPERNPLHEDALRLEDLQVGMKIHRYNIDPGTGQRYKRYAVITGEPFQRVNGAWMLPVEADDYHGGTVKQQWLMAHMGIVRYVGSQGHQLHWNDQNYTLRAE